MRAVMVMKNRDRYQRYFNSVLSSLEEASECKLHDGNGAGPCYCLNCRANAGKYYVNKAGDMTYVTGSGKGEYVFTASEVRFEGFRNSFKMGTEFFDARSLEEAAEGKWLLLESQEMDKPLEY